MDFLSDGSCSSQACESLWLGPSSGKEIPGMSSLWFPNTSLCAWTPFPCSYNRLQRLFPLFTTLHD